MWCRDCNVLEQFELTNVRIRQGKLLKFELAAEDQPINFPIPIPFGAVSNPTGYRFVAQVLDGQPRELIAIPAEDTKPVIGKAQILPPYRWKGVINTRKRGKAKVEVWQVTSDVDRTRAMQIILRSQ